MLSTINNINEYEQAVKSFSIPLDIVETQASKASSVHWEMARLDVIDEQLSGNKLFKLLPFLLSAKQQGVRQIVSFGGMHSNHLQALSAAGVRFGFGVVAVVRGYSHQPETPTLITLKKNNVIIHFADKKEYAQRHEKQYIDSIKKKYPQAMVIPEGGFSELGVEGAQIIAKMLSKVLADDHCYIATSVGTGATFLGLLTANVFSSRHTLLGFSALNNAAELSEQVSHLVCSFNDDAPKWHISDEFSFGGFAKMTRELAFFMRAFESDQGFLLDPVYTAKLCFAIDQKILSGDIPEGSKVITLHTGGLQGRYAMQQRIENYYKNDEAFVKYA